MSFLQDSSLQSWALQKSKFNKFSLYTADGKFVSRITRKTRHHLAISPQPIRCYSCMKRERKCKFIMGKLWRFSRHKRSAYPVVTIAHNSRNEFQFHSQFQCGVHKSIAKLSPFPLKTFVRESEFNIPLLRLSVRGLLRRMETRHREGEKKVTREFQTICSGLFRLHRAGN